MIRVLHVFGKLHRGGLETFVMNVYKYMDRSQVQFDFLLTIPGGDYEEDVIRMGGKIYYIPERNKGIYAHYKALDVFFKTHKDEYAAIHQHVSSLSPIIVLYYAKKHGVPVRILHSHSSTINSIKTHNIIHVLFKPAVKHLATHYLGCSDKAIHWLYRGTGIYHKAEMINNGIDTASYVYSPIVRREIRNSLGIKEELVIGHVGRFDKVKNHTFLLKIFAEILRTHPGAKLMLVGDGGLKSSIEKEAAELGIMDNLIMTGLRRDVNRLLSAMDIFVMPSLFEGLPVALVEAQAAGLPLVISDTISRDSQITESVKFVSLDETPQAWASKVLDSIMEYPRRDTSAQINDRGFGIEKAANRLLEIYSQKI